MINFYDGQIADILPKNLTKDPAVQALSLALREATRTLHKYTQLCYVYCSIDTAPDMVLNLLAQELRTQYYKDNLDIETKRSLVRNTLIWYMTAGTPAAVEELVAAVFGEGEVKEWFDYGGNPYWFKVKTNAILTEDMMDYFSEMIRRVKNTRSHLEAIEIQRTVEQLTFAGCCHAPQYRPAAIIDGYDISRRAEQVLYGGIWNSQARRPAAVIDGFREPGSVRGNFYAGTGQASQTHQEAVREVLSFGGTIHAEPVKTGVATTGATKPEAVTDGFAEDGRTVTGAIYAGSALSSKYTKATIAEGGNNDATAI